MKKLLPILLCYVLMTSQAYAISGGPIFGGGGTNPVGTYSGVINVNQELDLQNAVVDPVTGELVPGVVADVNAIGLFGLSVPQTSVATGTFLLFVDGVVYTGTITASVNPDSGKLSGLVQGTFPYTVSQISADGTISSLSVTAQANGKLTAQIGGTRQGSFSSASLVGTSNIDLDFGGVQGLNFVVNRRLNCSVIGFRQSLTATAITVTTGN